MKEVIEEIHKEDLELVKFFIEICNKNNLKYYIIGGTLLGAIRHRGFIPWDDDMDLAMPREDYEQFLQIMNENKGKYKIFNYKKDKEYKYYISRLCNTDFEIEEITGNITNLFIDIFPIDGMPNNSILRKIHAIRILYHRVKLSFYYNDTIDKTRKRKFYEKILIKLATTIPFKKIINPLKEKNKIDKLLNKYSFYNKKYAGTIMGAYRTREIVPTVFFGKPTAYEFEDIQLYGPEMYDEYLTHMYGKYMKLPKKEEQKIHCKELRRIR